MDHFSHRLIVWHERHGRHDLPWQVRDPYAIWLSEIMLQQTQVETVIPYFLRFMARFPDIASLASASEDDVLALWSGLGYYARARNLHSAARRMVERHDGALPRTFEDLLALPGVGRSTAAAIAVFAHGERRAILDGNVKRVLCRAYGIDGWPGERSVEEGLWTLAESLLPATGIVAYTQGLMDLGATLCRRGRPDCPICPYAEDCHANRHGRQTELPAARPRKDMPEKTTRMLVLWHAGTVLLEKRPAPGIWGGLWSFPECPAEADAAEVAGKLGYATRAWEDLAPVAHAFSHYRLTILPRLLTVECPPSRAEAPGRLWLSPEEAMDAALPAPVRRILQLVGEAAGPFGRVSRRSGAVC